ncbi:MAG: fibronectin type III domain-containing protein [Acutalibacteraceae bacterium]|nr:fibronectin type III domain-containing protein [Acutalibacteraceae bacterium]
MKKTLKALVLMTFCICMIMSSMVMASAIGKVTGAKATSVTYNSATLTWKKVSGADGYEVQQYKSKKWTTVKKIESGSTVSYKVSKLTTGTTYKYRVRAYDKRLLKTDYSAYVNITVKPLPAKVTGLKASSAGYNSVKLSWSKVSGASGYVVQQYKSKKWVDLKTVTSNSLTVTGLTTDTSYSFRVRAYRTVSKKKHYSASYSSTVKCTPKLPATSSVKVSKEATTSVYLTWSKVTGATGYQVYNPKTKKWESSKGKTSYTIKSLAANSKYTAKVRAFRKTSKKTYYGVEKSITFVTKPAALKNVKVSDITTNSLKVSWSKASNVSGYSVLVYDYSTKKETKTNTKSTSLTVKSLKSGTKYKVTVRAYAKNAEYIYSDNVIPFTGYTPLEIKAGKNTGNTAVHVTWNSISEATKYVLERYDSATNSWKTVYSGSTASYSDEIGENTGALYRVTPYKSSTALAVASASAELATKGITLSKATNKITVTWKKPETPNTIYMYSVYEKPRSGSGKTAEELAYVINAEDTKETLFTAYNTEQTYVIYAIYGTDPKSIYRAKVAEFTVRAEDLVIDSTDTSKNGQILKLVDAINRTKYEQGKVSVTQNSTISLDVNSISMSLDLYAFMELASLVDPNMKINGFSYNKNTDKMECSGEKNIKAFMEGIMGSSDENLNTQIKVNETITFIDGKGINSNSQYSYLNNYIEPSIKDPYIAYLYNGNDVSKWDEGFSSVTTKVLSNGNYSFEGTIKKEEFGSKTTSTATAANYHAGFTSSFDGLNLGATDGMDNVKTTVGATKLTAEYTPDGKLVKYNIGKTTINMDLEASMGDIETDDGKKISNASIGMGMNGDCTLSYSFKR